MPENQVVVTQECIDSISSWFDYAESTEFEDFPEYLDGLCRDETMSPKEKAESFWRWLAGKLS